MIYWVDKVARTSLSHILIFAVVLTAVRLAVLPYLRNTPAHQRTGLFKFTKFMNETMDALIYASIVVFMLVRPFGIQTFHIPTGSMLQTLYERDFIIANKMIYRYTEPKVGDIVVFHPPKRAFREGEAETDYIKRLVGGPGDVVEIRDMVLYRNGKPVDEPYLFYHSDQGGDGVMTPFTPLPKDQWHTIQAREDDFKLVEVDGDFIPLLYKGASAGAPLFVDDRALASTWLDLPAAPIPPGYFMFMGDHRNGSSDSRFWGLVPRENIIGRSEYIMLPFNRIGKTR
jgi:signal peptidase I